MSPIREDDVYGGTRLSLIAFVGSARLPVQLDIGVADAITPAPELPEKTRTDSIVISSILPVWTRRKRSWSDGSFCHLSR
jgi:hypothetical protein